ncbi:MULTISPECIES: ABC transporter ATP-binding protein [unclassified Streptomyces]|uniref:ABC transporter ATP-binding protein n=1 Tax=unclassified Streptomyces TaxID=2593676 RepID=UPI002E2C4FCC|nr:ABC transporter ATP-binding protein [Streptomyces sp. NBC_00223]
MPRFPGGPAEGPIREEFRRRRFQAALAFVLILAAAGSSLWVPMSVKQVVQDLGSHKSPVWSVITLGLLALGGAMAGAWSSFLLGRIGEYAILETRGRVVRHAMSMRLLDVRRIGAGQLAARVTTDAAQLRSMVDVGVTALPVSALISVVSLVLMGLLDWVLLLIVVVTFLVAGAAIAVFVRNVRKGLTEQQEALGSLAQAFTAALGSLSTIKANRAETSAARAVTAEAETATHAAISADRAQVFISPLMGLGQQIAIIGVVAGSGARLASGALAPADFVAFLMYLFQLIAPLTTVASGLGRVQAGLSASGRIRELLGMPVENPGPDHEPPAVAGAPALRLRGLTGGYDGEPVLHGVTLTVPARGLTALVGPSGAGKSTVLTMVERLLEPTSGSVELHGVPLDRWPLTALRSRISYVDQSFTLLDGTVRENLTLGLRTAAGGDVPDDALLDALAMVGMDLVVRALPDGLDTRVGGASDLSGGQRQRLALARALLSDADVVLLDEPSSQLDGVNEQLLRKAVDRLAADRAVVVVAHRLSTVQHADQIVFVQDGEVLGAGPHFELLRECEGYRSLVSGQNGTGAGSSAEAEAPAALIPATPEPVPAGR